MGKVVTELEPIGIACRLAEEHLAEVRRQRDAVAIRMLSDGRGLNDTARAMQMDKGRLSRMARAAGEGVC